MKNYDFLNSDEQKFLYDFEKNLESYRNLTPYILSIIAQDYKNFQDVSEKKNNTLLREALGDACIILSMKRKPNEKELPKYLERIKQAIFPKGITEFHHDGEKNFYNKFFGK